jgi:hypothetical protein
VLIDARVPDITVNAVRSDEMNFKVDFVTMAERELSAFLNATTQLFGTGTVGALGRRLAAGVD